jgi:hypothetical protein
VDSRSDRVRRLMFCAALRATAGGLPAWHSRCSGARRRLPGDLHVKDPKRLLPAILFCSFAFALWPSQAAAQRRGHPVCPGGSAVVAVHPSFSGDADLLHDRLRGVSGSISLRFGGH